MSTVRPFNKERILEYIKNNDLRHLTDADGDYLVRFGNNGISFDCYMLAGGSRGEVLTLMASRQTGTSDSLHLGVALKVRPDGHQQAWIR